MEKIIRYRVHGVIDGGVGGINFLLEYMRQYGSACLVDTEVVEEDEPPPDAKKDFKQRYHKKE